MESACQLKIKKKKKVTQHKRNDKNSQVHCPGLLSQPWRNGEAGFLEAAVNSPHSDFAFLQNEIFAKQTALNPYRVGWPPKSWQVAALQASHLQA